MSILTTFFNLIKPAKTDGVKVSDFNENMDIIDTEMHKPPLTVNGIEPDSTTRDLYLEQVPLADNLASDIAQMNYGEFVVRTSGGDTSIDDGEASLVSVKGNMIRTGYVAESLDMTVSPVTREEGVDPITATIDRDTFVAYVSDSGTVTLVYTTAWSANPANYGITVTGTPMSGDVITVVYVKENRGTIAVAEPSAFNATGWNLYNNDAGYARVVAYSAQYGYRIGGNYSLISFAPTLTGEQTGITVTGGLFNVAEDGYIFVTGGDETTYIYPTWSDWTDGYNGDFQTYTASTINLATAMLNFPYGLCAVGDVRDEINVNVQRTIQRITRVAYSEENLATVVASGAPYIYDTNYIYSVLTDPVTTSIEIDGVYTVSDHGIEFFSGTTVPVYTETLYGENLKDKLRTDVVTLSEQTLSAAQQAQVQTNLDVPSNANAVHKTGVEHISGLKVFDGGLSTTAAQSPAMYFTGKDLSDDSARILAISAETSNGKYGNTYFQFRHYSPSADGNSRTNYYERYNLPAVDTARSSSTEYEILTNKKHIRSIGTISSGTGNSIQVTFSEAGSYLFVVDSTADTRMYFGIVHAASNNTPFVKDIYKGSSITVTTASGKVTFANSSSSGATVYIISLGSTGWTSTKV